MSAELYCDILVTTLGAIFEITTCNWGANVVEVAITIYTRAYKMCQNRQELQNVQSYKMYRAYNCT